MTDETDEVWASALPAGATAYPVADRYDWSDRVWASDLKPLERLAALVYAKHASRSTSAVWVSLTVLIEHTGMSRDAAARALRGLREKGWLMQTERARQHRSARYALTAPSSTSDGRLTSGATTSSSTGDRLLNEPSSTPPVASSTSPVTSSTGDVPEPYRTSYEPTPAGTDHKHEPNARRALDTIIGSRRLPFTIDELVAVAYSHPTGDPWEGYLIISDATRVALDGAHDRKAVVLSRLKGAGLTVPTTRRQAVAA